MDRGKRPGKYVGAPSHKIYMDLKDIIREHALQYLPAKSLFRFQSVCRDWNLQISSPFFAHNQSHSFHSILGLFGQTPGEPPSFLSFDAKSCGVPDPLLTFIPDPVEILSSSNGLLCCKSCSVEKVYYICNPVTQQWKKLPKSNARHGSDPAIVLVFEPSLLNFDADFKLICAFPSNDFDDAIEFEIYSSRDDSWKISGEICFASKTLVPTSGIHVKNVVYWNLKQGGVLAFDLIKDRSQLFQGYYGAKGTLGNVNGRLCSVSWCGRELYLHALANVHSNTMEMTSHVKTWEQKHVVLESGFLGGDVANAKVIFAGGDMLVIQCRSSIYLHNLKTQETKALSILIKNHSRCLPYVNSIVNI